VNCMKLWSDFLDSVSVVASSREPCQFRVSNKDDPNEAHLSVRRLKSRPLLNTAFWEAETPAYANHKPRNISLLHIFHCTKYARH
jgi:hypothetical protein